MGVASNILTINQHDVSSNNLSSLPVILFFLYHHHQNIQLLLLHRITTLILVRQMWVDMELTRIHIVIWSKKSYLRTNVNPTSKQPAGLRIKKIASLFFIIIVRASLRLILNAYVSMLTNWFVI